MSSRAFILFSVNIRKARRLLARGFSRAACVLCLFYTNKAPGTNKIAIAPTSRLYLFAPALPTRSSAAIPAERWPAAACRSPHAFIWVRPCPSRKGAAR